jgi:TP901-1 family phage major tail protein
MAQNGTDFLLLVNTGTEEIPVYEAVGSQRDATVEETTDTIDISSKDSRAMRVLPGRYASSISLGALYVPDNDAYLALKSANRNGDLILVARQNQGVVTEIVSAKIDSISQAFPDQQEATIAVTLTVDGFWTEVSS